MRPIRSIGITLLLLWALFPGVGEIFENVAHVATEGHLAHAAPEGDRHDSPGPEHGCSGTMHLCSCCVSPSFTEARSVAQVPCPVSNRLEALADAYPLTMSSGGVYHPPRA